MKKSFLIALLVLFVFICSSAYGYTIVLDPIYSPSDSPYWKCKNEYGIGAEAEGETCKCGYSYFMGNKDGKPYCINGDHFCKEQNGVQATFNTSNKTCECPAGYLLLPDTSGKNICTNMSTYCQDLYGPNGMYEFFEKKCGCAFGYIINEVSGLCEKNNNSTSSDDEVNSLIHELEQPISENCGKNSTMTNVGKCKCNTGYVWQYPDDSNNYDCVIKTIETNTVSCGKNSTKTSAGACICNSGYVLDPGDVFNSNCVLEENVQIVPTDWRDEIGSILFKQEDIAHSEFVKYANLLAGRGIIINQENVDDYNVFSPLLRQELIGIALKLRGVQLVDNYQCKKMFSDVTAIKPNNWVCRAAETAAMNEIITKENKKFNPEQNVTFAEGLAMIFNSLNNTEYSAQTISGNYSFYPNTTEWQKRILEYAKSIQVINNTLVNPNRPILRGEIFELIITTEELLEYWANK